MREISPVPSAWVAVPIDISWAVQPKYLENGALNANAGKPVALDDITFVRIFTAAARDNPPFGEISTEVCGVYKATRAGSDTARYYDGIVYYSNFTALKNADISYTTQLCILSHLIC